MSENWIPPRPWEVFTLRGKLPKVREVRNPHGEAPSYSATISEVIGGGICNTVFKLDFGYGRKNAEAIADMVAAAPKLYGALDRLAHEAQGFLAIADREVHGNTNIAVMRDRIREAFDVLAEARGDDQQPDDGRDGRDDLDDRDPMQIAAERCPPRE